MTHQIETETDFEQALASLLASAEDKDIQVAGGWSPTVDGEQPRWDVVVTELEL